MDNKPIRIVDINLNLLAEIDDYNSLIITRDYFKGGDLTLIINKNKKNVEYLVEGNILFPFNQRNKPYLIQYVQLTKQDGKQNEIINIKAIHLVTAFNQRITIPPFGQDFEIYNSTEVETIIKNYINSNVINPSNSNREISIYTIATDQQRGPQIDDQTRYKNLYEETLRLVEGYEFGQQIILDFNTKKAVYDIFEGINHAYDQTINEPVVFSPSFGNVQSQEVINNKINYKNTAYTGGQGEGSLRTVEIVNDTNNGFNRLEMFIDARDINTISELQDRGFQKLQSFPPIETFNGQILNTSNTKYEVHWNLGDIVTLEDIELNVRINKRIIEIKEIYEAGNSQKLQINLGKPIDTIQSVINRGFERSEQEITK